MSATDSAVTVTGSDWTDVENDCIVADDFTMLGRKTALRRPIRPQSRSAASAPNSLPPPTHRQTSRETRAQPLLGHSVATRTMNSENRDSVVTATTRGVPRFRSGERVKEKAPDIRGNLRL